MIQNVINKDAERAANRYGVLLDTMRNLFLDTALRRDVTSEATRRAMRDQIYVVGRDLLARESQFARESASQIAISALRNAHNDLGSIFNQAHYESALNDALRETGAYLEREIAAQIERDIAQLERQTRQVAVQVGLLASKEGISKEQALLKQRVRGLPDLRFFFMDRSAKRWSSDRFIRAIWRQSMLAIYNEFYMTTAIEAGVNTLYVAHRDPQNRNHGRAIAITADGSLNTYLDLKDEVFHPNSEAVLSLVEP